MANNHLLVPPITVLLIEDNPGDARLIRELLNDTYQKEGDRFHLEYAGTLWSGLARLSEGGVDVVLLDLSLPDSTGLDTLSRVYAHAPGLPILVLTGLEDEKVGLEAVHQGAQDYLVKGHVVSSVLARSLHYAIERKHLEKQKDDFMALASHELRTPLAIIRGSVQMALRAMPEPGDEKLSRTLRIVNAQTGRITRLINDLLDAPRIHDGMVPFYMEAFDMCHLVEDVVTDMASTALDFTFVPALPTAGAVINGDRDRIEQVITNLLHNAVKYSTDNKRIEITVELGDAEVVAAVRDYGIGIPSDQQAQVFQRFFRGRNVDVKHYGGMGLGLYISHGIVQRHGGRIWLNSIDEAGSTFYFSLPLAGGKQ